MLALDVFTITDGFTRILKAYLLELKKFVRSVILTASNIFNNSSRADSVCNFEIDFEEEDNRSVFFLKRNSPWWTGALGVSRVKSRAKKLTEAIHEAVRDQGGKSSKIEDS